MTRNGGHKKPLSKSVVALNEQLRRKRETRDLAERFLIVCEDTKSAVNYFKSLVAHYKLSAASVQVSHSRGRTQPIQVVDAAIEFRDEANREDSGSEPFHHIWCIIDGDYGNKIVNARKKAHAEGIRLAVSTKCFEHWVSLHFAESGTPANDCDEVVKLLIRQHIKDYKKGSYDFKEIVKHVEIARDRARKQRKPGIDRKEMPEDHNPCSEVYLLIDELLKAT